MIDENPEDFENFWNAIGMSQTIPYLREKGINSMN